MASIYQKKFNEQGKLVSAKVRINQGKRCITRTFKASPNWSEKRTDTELFRFAIHLENDFSSGKLKTKRERERDLSELSFTEYADRYLKEIKSQVKPGTHYTYVVQLRKAQNFFRSEKLRQIDRVLCWEYRKRLIAAGGKNASLRTNWRCLSALFAYAVKAGTLEANPLHGMEAPKRKDGSAEEPGAYTSEELARICGALADTPPVLKALLLLLITTGCRIGEALGLDWEAVDFEKRVIHIRQSAQYTPALGNYLTTPKNGRSRTVFLSDDTAAALKALPWQQDRGACFRTKSGTERLCDRQARALLRKFLDCLGMEDTHFHKLRHTHITLLAQRHVGDVVIRSLVGHSSAAMTQHYTHVTEEGMREAREIITTLV